MAQSDADLAQDKRDLFLASWGNIAGFLVRLGVRIPFLYIAGELYGTSKYGEYVLIIAVIDTLALVANFGFNRSLCTFINTQSDENEGSVIRHIVALTISIGALLAAGVYGLADIIAATFNIPDAANLLRVAALVIPVAAVTEVLLAATAVRRIIRYEIYARSVIEPGTLTVAAFVLFSLGFEAYGLVAAYIIARCLTAGVVTVSFTRLFGLDTWRGEHWSLARFKQLLSASAPTSFHEMMGVVMSRIDVFAIGFFFSDAAVGLYAMAQQFMTVVEKVSLSFYALLMPLLSQSFRAGDVSRAFAQARAVGGRTFMVQAPIVLLFVLFGGPLLGLVGDEFRQASGILTVLAVGILFNNAIGLSEHMLVVLRPSGNTIASLSALLFYAAAAYPVQAAWGPTGIAIASVVAAAFGNCIRIAMCMRPLSEMRDQV